ncbi:amino acid adenylation domain-containing protein [Streptomyces sp. HK10]|uniref:amino acid adenylation domain-containing protein n=1 Tax=Streptomyces sp. HK10 TaxID=3373255 RepID=UPI003747E425
MTSPPSRPARLDGLLAAAARDHPDAVAVTDGRRAVTYRSLEQTVRGIAGALSAAGVRPGDRVGVYLPKGVDAVAAVYAVLRSGAVAAPLDVGGPHERTARMVENAGVGFLITSPDTEASAAQVGERVGHGPAPAGHLAPGLSVLPLVRPTADLPQATGGGYLLFTSGSTGWPKGVLLSHGNVLHFVRWAVDELGVRSSDRIGSQSSLTFDLSTFDIFGSAMSAARLVLLPEPLKAFPRDVVRWLAAERISVFYAVPTLYQALLHKGGVETTPLPDLRVAAFAGEPFPAGDLERCVSVLKAAEFYNLYGPTETNVCTFEKLPPGWTARDALPVGRAIAGVHVSLVDREHRVTSDEGEIAVAGPTVFLGYLQDGRLREHTTPITLEDGTTRRAYLTGDLGHYGGDGRIHLRGRRDHQVKRRGYRIDLLDIESVVQEIPAVRSCAAVWTDRDRGGGRIRLYAVADGVSEQRLREAVFEVLPRHMMPDHVHLVDRLRLTDRGKIDRESLASAEPTQGRDHGKRR